MWTASLGASRHPLASLQQLQDELRSAGGRSPSELFGRVAVVDVGHVAAMFFFFGGGDVSHSALVLHGGAGLDFSCNFDILFFGSHGKSIRWRYVWPMEIDQGEALGIRTMRDVLKRAVGHLSVRNGGVLPEGFFWFLWKHQRWQPCYELYLL